LLREHILYAGQSLKQVLQERRATSTAAPRRSRNHDAPSA